MRLFLVELRRLFARRFFRLGLVILVAGLAVLLVNTAYHSRPPTAAAISEARQLHDQAEQQLAQQRAACERGERPQGTDPTQPGPFPQDCSELRAGPLASFLVDPRFNFHDAMPGYVKGLAVVLALFAFLVGATFVGAEWHHGTMTGLLLWEPRRLRVFLAKLAALLAGMLATGVVLLAAATGGLWWIARSRGFTTGVTQPFLQSLGLTTMRGLGFALLAGAIGFAIAYSLRHTAAALGAGVAYFVIGEFGLRIFSDRTVPWLLTTNVDAWFSRGLTVEIGCGNLSVGCGRSVHIGMWQGALYLAALGAVLVVAAALSFRRREVA